MLDLTPFAIRINELENSLEAAKATIDFWKNKVSHSLMPVPSQVGSSRDLSKEVMHWKEEYGRAVSELEQNGIASQIKYDELHAQYIVLKDDLEKTKKELKATDKELEKMDQEIMAYDLFVKRTGGVPISEVRKLVNACSKYGRNPDRDPMIFHEKVLELKDIARYYSVILDRYPSLGKLVGDYSFTGEAGSSSAVVVRQPASSVSLQRAQPSTGKGRRGERSSGRGALGRGASGRGVSGRGLNIDALLNTNFEAPSSTMDLWLNCSQGSRARRSG